jgi:thiosulfate sulfurtransferase
MSYQELRVNQLESFLQQEGAVVIDIRDIHSFKADHIKGAMHIDGPTMGNLIRQRKNNPPVLVYCYHGNFSHDIASMIVGFGFNNVSHLVGGWQAWSEHQRTCEKKSALFDAPLIDAFA